MYICNNENIQYALGFIIVEKLSLLETYGAKIVVTAVL